MTFNLMLTARVLGILTLTMGIFMLPACFVSLCLYESSSAAALAGAAGISLASGLFLLLQKPNNSRFHIRDCFLTVCLSWFFASLLSSLPYLLSGAFPSVIDCIFEGFSGITLTGATVLADIEILPKGLLLWRACSQWLGGLGVLVLLLSLFAEADIGGMQISRRDGLNLVSEQHALRLTPVSLSLIYLYLGLTAACLLLLSVCGLGFFDAVCQTATTLSSGGFSNYNENMGHFSDRPFILYVTTFFSLLSAVNFYLYFHLLRKRYRQVARDSELKFFLFLTTFFAFILFLSLYFSDATDLTGTAGAAASAVFLSVSAVSTSGFYLSEPGTFPALCRLLLLILILIGGCSGSLSGGLKMGRVLTLVRSVLQNLKTLLHPSAVLPVKMGTRTLSPEFVKQVVAFAILYALTFLFGCLLVSFDIQDMSTALTVSASCLSGTGLGLWDSVAPTCFASFSEPVKLGLSFLMLAGRLDIYAALLLFTPDFWRPRQ